MTINELNANIDDLRTIATNLYYMKYLAYFLSFMENDFCNGSKPQLNIMRDNRFSFSADANSSTLTDLKTHVDNDLQALEHSVRNYITEHINAVHENIPDFDIDDPSTTNAVLNIDWDQISNRFFNEVPNPDICDMYLEQMIKIMNIPGGDYKVITNDFDTTIMVENKDFAETLSFIFDSISVYHVLNGESIHLYDT